MLVKEAIRKEIEENSLVENHCHLDTQLQPNGIDLTVSGVYEFKEEGSLDFSNSERSLPESEEIQPVKENEDDKYGWWKLDKGVYKIIANEKINLPNDMVGVFFTRTSLLRMGCYTQHGLIDSGFKGNMEFILVVGENGLNLKQNARVCQLTFEKVSETESYQGVYSSE
ncbi:MAG: deoxyuridine 5'-triphosphate nucleotidohydrolase [Candidatus Pacearchaeota archaeon]